MSFIPSLGTEVWTMPVYEFKCPACGAREEHTLGFDDPRPEICAACGGALKRVWSGRVHVSLEGWGFSKTDSLVSGDTSAKDFKKLKERADQIRDE